MSRTRLAVAGVASVLALAALPSAASAEQVTITSFDGTRIDADFQRADGLAAGAKAPTIVLTHGFGATRETTEIAALAEPLGQVPAGAFRARGYNTITYDSRGFGRSGGEIDLDSPEREGRDASAVIDYVATRPEARLDAPGDPRVGMHGASYGGGVQWAAASRDMRIDALAPSISWTSLVQALARDGRLKLGWGLPLVGLGEASGLALGAFAPQGIELGAFPVELIALATKAAVTGRADDALTGYLRARSTGDGIAKVRAPSLIVQGTADTLFGLNQSAEMRRLLRQAGTPVKMLWFCGGHGVCLTGSGGDAVVTPRVLNWMDRWLKADASVPTGPGFEWVADDGKLRAAADFPLKSAGTITASGSGTLPITPLSSASGLLVAATRASSAVEVPVPVQTATKDVVGAPVVRLRYRGTSTAPDTHLYAQLLDETRGVVVGNQVTPLPVTLDGQEHVVERSLEGVAMRVTPGSRYRLQVTDGSNVYGLTTGVGAAQLDDVRLTLPVGDAAGTVADPALTGATPVAAPPAGAGGGKTARTRTVTKRIRVGTLRSRGVLLRGTTTKARRTTVRLVVSAAVAKRLGLRSRTIATGRTAKRRSWSLRLKPAARTATVLRRRASTVATVRVSSGTVRPNRVVVRR
ncbi:alpha/beta fold hydrolase [Patulibacter sp.]|uniref:alpha/beta fold hydrolase n=1 Tax=Patulibacter sp. TaxID=1912859 RepID=UPI0027236FF8|nr:alpha/beta fold hydrolase [Patulibacter sp.]MDO9408051.1 alpha/beta fold hydrolase [Patulibacter sp.]